VKWSPYRWHAAIVLACLILYLPCTGSYGLWDPWETHYAEVAREILENGDWISLTWTGAPGEHAFWSKPPLAMWSQAIGLAALNVPIDDGAALASGSRAEWAVRLPSLGFGILALWAVAFATSRLLGRRAATLAVAVLATCPLYALVAHQAMTDIYLVGTITAAICLVAVALLDEERPISPWHALAWVAAGALLVATGPQLLGLARRVPLYQVVPYIVALGALLCRIARAPTQADALLHVAFVLAGLSILAKGVLGLGLAGTTLVLYLVVTRELRAVWRLRPVDAVVTIALVAAPWHHAMYALHGRAFLDELFFLHQWSRMGEGVYGDSGTLSYFVRQLGYGALPWVAVGVGAFVAALRAARGRGFLLFVVIWFVVAYAVVTASATKFHHYILPALPPLAIACGWFLDRCLAGDAPLGGRAAMLALGVPIAALAGHDLLAHATSPERLLWTFTFDYMLGEEPWPNDFELRPVLAVTVVVAIGATIALARQRAAAVTMLAATAFGCVVFLQTIAMPRASIAMSQKQTIARVYQERPPSAELHAAWLYFRGENFYTANELRPPAVTMAFEGGVAAQHAPERPLYILTRYWAVDHLMTWLPTAHVLEDDNPRVKVLVVPARP
jgi:4-amino-4-deoxy-L-arabinose transferase-like glycosyltransferase